MASSGECLAGHIEVSHFFCSFLVLHLGLCLDRSLCGGIGSLDFHCRAENLLRVRWNFLLSIRSSNVLELAALLGGPYVCV